MRLVAHRINTLAELAALDERCAIEFDLRDSGGKILVTHDPFTDGEDFSEFVGLLKGRFLIVNIKSEGIEYKVLELLKGAGCEDFFLLDCSPPMMMKLSSAGETRLAVRFSEMETLESVLCWKGRVQWVWVDCFFGQTLNAYVADLLRAEGFKLCLVSPDLQKRPEDIEPYVKYLAETGCSIDAVCCKVPQFELWKRLQNL
jgi:hypothetical protein